MSGIGGRAPATCAAREGDTPLPHSGLEDRKSTRLNSSHSQISYAVFCLKKKKQQHEPVAYNSSKTEQQSLSEIQQWLAPYTVRYLHQSLYTWIYYSHRDYLYACVHHPVR